MTPCSAESKVRDTRPTVTHSCTAGAPHAPPHPLRASVWMQGATCPVHIPANLHGNSHLAVSGDAARVHVHGIFNQCPWIPHSSSTALQGFGDGRKLNKEGCFLWCVCACLCVYMSVRVSVNGKKKNLLSVTSMLHLYSCEENWCGYYYNWNV